MVFDQNHVIDLVTAALDRDFDVEDYDIDGKGVKVYYPGATFTIAIESA